MTPAPQMRGFSALLNIVRLLATKGTMPTNAKKISKSKEKALHLLEKVVQWRSERGKEESPEAQKPQTTIHTTMTTLQKQKKLIGEIACCHDRETGELLDRVSVQTMDDAWTICCSTLRVEKGHLVMYTARLKYVFDNSRLAVIATA